MQKELEQIIKAYGLENTRIQRGRQRIYPHREGLEPTVQQIADLKSVLDGTSVKGFLEIKSGDVVIAANTAGAIERAFDRSFMPAQTQLFTPELPVESKTEAPSTQDPFDRALEKLDRMDESFDRMEVLIEQMNPDSNVVDAKARFEAISTAPEPILEKAPEPETSYYENIPHDVEQAANQAKNEQFAQASNQAQEVDPESVVVAPTVESPKERSSDIDYPSDAQTLDPTVNLKNTIAQGTATIQEKVLSASETLKFAQKNMTTFAKQVKHRGLKAWAKEQLPILQTKAIELAQVQAAKIGEYVKEQAPIVKEAAIAAAKQAGEYVKEQTPVVRDAAISGAKQVGEYVREHAPVVRDAAISGTKQAIEYAKEQAPVVKAAVKAGVVKAGDSIFQLEQTPVIDAPKIQELGARVLAGDAQYQGKMFDFAKTETGVNISLKNGTPVFVDGKLNPNVANSHVTALSQLADKLAQVKAPALATDEKRTKAIAR
jgi:hypothetical protein